MKKIQMQICLSITKWKDTSFEFKTLKLESKVCTYDPWFLHLILHHMKSVLHVFTTFTTYTEKVTLHMSWGQTMKQKQLAPLHLPLPLPSHFVFPRGGSQSNSFPQSSTSIFGHPRARMGRLLWKCNRLQITSSPFSNVITNVTMLF